MQFEFPKFPFVWDYSDMYNIIDYKSINVIPEDYDEHLTFLNEKFPNSQIISATQVINSRDTAKNINIHTWYLDQKKIFESTESNIKVITDSKYKFKANVRCFIFDPNDLIDNSIWEVKKFPNIAVIKKKTSIIPELIPLLYIHTHNIKGIFRFSPNDNNKINIRESVTNGIFYVILDKLIVKLEIIIK